MVNKLFPPNNRTCVDALCYSILAFIVTGLTLQTAYIEFAPMNQGVVDSHFHDVGIKARSVDGIYCSCLWHRVDSVGMGLRAKLGFVAAAYCFLGWLAFGCTNAPLETAGVEPTPSFDLKPSPSLTLTLQVKPSPSSTPSPAPTRVQVGPEYVPGVDPLTGLPFKDTEPYTKAPILVSITNFPVSARPQAGLSEASHVWETSIAQGMTRFIGVYYGDYLERLRRLEINSVSNDPYGFVLGPIRSGRVGFEEIKGLYPAGRLFIRYASKAVIAQLSAWELVDVANTEDVNSAGLYLEELEQLDLDTVHPQDYASLSFDSIPPKDGTPRDSIEIIYNIYDYVGWQYDPISGEYLRFQDQADGTGEMVPAKDRLTDEQLHFENVLLMFAQHSFQNLEATILDIQLRYVPGGYGYLFRDGMQYPIRWSTRKGELIIHDDEGNPIPLKPGQTFFEVISQFSTWDDEVGLARFHSPAIPTLTITPSPTTTSTATPTPTEVSSPDPPTAMPDTAGGDTTTTE